MIETAMVAGYQVGEKTFMREDCDGQAYNRAWREHERTGLPITVIEKEEE